MSLKFETNKSVKNENYMKIVVRKSPKVGKLMFK